MLNLLYLMILVSFSPLFGTPLLPSLPLTIHHTVPWVTFPRTTTSEATLSHPQQWKVQQICIMQLQKRLKRRLKRLESLGSCRHTTPTYMHASMQHLRLYDFIFKMAYIIIIH